MGQQISASFLPNDSIEPGTYRIIHDETGKALRIHEDDQMLMTWDGQAQGSNPHEGIKDHWFLLRSGDGYVFKHRQRGTYIGISFKSDPLYPVLATPSPTTWVIFTKGGSSNSECVIATDKAPWRVVSLHSGSNSSGANDDRLRLTRLYEYNDERWRLERIGDATGEAEETRLLRQQLKVAKTELVEKQAKLKIVEGKLAVNMRELTKVLGELCRKTGELEEQREALDQAMQELSTAKEEISEHNTANDEMERRISERDEIVHTKNAELTEKDRIIAQLEEMVRSSNEHLKERREFLSISAPRHSRGYIIAFT
ncbi:hypothetical protein RSAG8_03258, partial [Rhizoctonia solani AG-8 WAC10335]